jgi:hypothetical protein
MDGNSTETGRKGAYTALLVTSGLLAGAAIASLLPDAGARWPSILGYRAFCSFAPISTALCALAALAVCVIRSRLFGPRRGEARPWTMPIVALAVLVAVIAVSAPIYAAAKAPAADSGSGASLVAGEGN